MRRAAELTGYSSRDIVSGAGHDAAYVSRVAPAAMIFVPCRDGISHNEAEYSSKEQCAKGAQVLLQAVLDYDRQLAERGGDAAGGRSRMEGLRLPLGAVRGRLSRRLERQHQAHARSAGDDGADRDRRGPRGAAGDSISWLA